MKHFLIIIASFFIISKSFSQDPFVVKRDAFKLSERCYKITSDINNERGAIWQTEKVDFSQNQILNYVLYMGERDSGADGAGFIIHNDPKDTIGSGAFGDPGGGMGFGEISGYGYERISPSIAVEFDTWDNGDIANNFEPSFDHTTIVYNGNMYEPAFDAVRLLPAAHFPSDNIEDGNSYMIQFRWIHNPEGDQTLELWIDKYNGSTDTSGLVQVFAHTENYVDSIFGGETLLRVGFTATTGGRTNEQVVCLLGENGPPFAKDDYITTEINTKAIIPSTLNDSDPDEDELFIPKFRMAPSHGIINIVDTLIAGRIEKFLEYYPDDGFHGLDTMEYVVCDVNSTNSFAKCDTASVFIEVNCLDFEVEAIQVKANDVCSDALPANGIGQVSASAILPAKYTSIWHEDFEDLSIGTNSDNGSSGWTINHCSDSGDAVVDTYVGRKMFRFSDTDCDENWISDVIDISNYESVRLDVGVHSSGILENADYIRVRYLLNETGPWITFEGNGNNNGDFGFTVARTNELSGSTVRIGVTARNTASNEHFYIEYASVRSLESSVPATFQYEWYNSSDTSQSPFFYGDSVGGLTGGSYTVVAIEESSGCTNINSVQIDHFSAKPEGAITWKVSPATTCIPPYDGTLAAGILEGSDTITAGYDFKWYLATEPYTGTVLGNNSTLDFLQATAYAVVITDMSTGCDTLLNDLVEISVVIPEVNTSLVDGFSSCVDNSATVSASVNGDTLGYLFEWWKGSIMGSPIDSGWVKEVTEPGRYFVHATDFTTGCRSSEAGEVDVQWFGGFPEVEVVTKSDYSCNPSFPRGTATAISNSPGFPDDFLLEWFQNDTTGSLLGTGTFINQLEGGSDPGARYSLRFTNTVSECMGVVDFFINDSIRFPVIDSIQSVPSASCDANGNGSLFAFANGETDPFILDSLFEFVWYDSTNQVYIGDSSYSIHNLSPGNYELTVVDPHSECRSFMKYGIVQGHVGSEELTPTFSTVPNSACDPKKFSGNIDVTAINADDNFRIEDFKFEWFDWQDKLLNGRFMNGDSSRIDSLAGGEYKLRLTKKSSGCFIEDLVTVPNDWDFPEIRGGVFVHDAQREQAPYYSGAQITGVILNGVLTLDPNELTFHWVRRLDNYLLTDKDSIISDYTLTADSLPPGLYSVAVETSLGCVSDCVNFTIGGISVVELTGQIKNATGDTMQSVAVAMSNNFGEREQQLTDNNGEYRLTATINNEIVIQPLLEENMRFGVTSMDALMTLRHLFEIDPFDEAYAHLAADMNGDKQISVSDVGWMKSILLGVTEDIPNRNSWIFFNNTYSESEPLIYQDTYLLTVPNNDIEDLDFTALKLGDVNLSNGLNSKLETDFIALTLGEPISVNGKWATPVSATQDIKLSAIQFEMDAENSFELENGLISVETATDNSGSVAGIWVDENGQYVNVTTDDVLFYITSDQMFMVDVYFDTNDIQPAAVSNDLTEHELRLAKSITGVEDQLFDTKVFPNPASKILHVESSHRFSQATIYSLAGSLISKFEIRNNSIDISFLQEGAYILKMTADEIEFTTKFRKE